MSVNRRIYVKKYPPPTPIKEEGIHYFTAFPPTDGEESSSSAPSTYRTICYQFDENGKSLPTQSTSSNLVQPTTTSIQTISVMPIVMNNLITRASMQSRGTTAGRTPIKTSAELMNPSITRPASPTRKAPSAPITRPASPTRKAPSAPITRPASPTKIAPLTCATWANEDD